MITNRVIFGLTGRKFFKHLHRSKQTFKCNKEYKPLNRVSEKTTVAANESQKVKLNTLNVIKFKLSESNRVRVFYIWHRSNKTIICTGMKRIKF